MPDLKQYLEQYMCAKITEQKKIVNRWETAKNKLGKLNLENAEYHVQLRVSAQCRECLEEAPGFGTVRLTHKGNIEDAIKKAEENFRVPTSEKPIYSVYVKIGKMTWPVPEEAWAKYKGKYLIR